MFLMFHAVRHEQAETFVVPSKAPLSQPQLVLPVKNGLFYTAEHSKGFVYVVTNDGAPDFQVLRAPIEVSTAKITHEWTPVVLEKKGRRIDNIDMFENHLVIYMRQLAQPLVQVINLQTLEYHNLDCLPESPFHLVPGVNQVRPFFFVKWCCIF
jgi:oligopeptidase B